jgi:hypothetical protein
MNDTSLLPRPIRRRPEKPLRFDPAADRVNKKKKKTAVVFSLTPQAKEPIPHPGAPTFSDAFIRLF